MMEHIETIELESSQSSITFSSIPQDYDDLNMLISSRGDTAYFLEISFNGSFSNFTGIGLQGSGSSASSFSRTDSFIGYNTGPTFTADTFGNAQVYISNYKRSSAKSISADLVSENNDTSSNQVIYAGLWNQTAAITSLGLRILDADGNFVTGSTFSLYGITAGGDGSVTTS